MKIEKFRNKEITITYNPFKCEQADFCTQQLANVFQDSVIPWIDPNGEDTETIIKQIKKCPSGALSFKLNKEEMAY